MAKSPIMRFSPDDWAADIGIQALSYFERGIWFELMLKMHASPRIGKLILTSGIPVTDSIIASNLLKIERGEWDKAKAILLKYGVAAICPDTGALMCSKMVQAERNRALSRAHGKRGGATLHRTNKPTNSSPPLRGTLRPPLRVPLTPPLRVSLTSPLRDPLPERKEAPPSPSHSPFFKRKEKEEKENIKKKSAQNSKNPENRQDKPIKHRATVAKSKLSQTEKGRLRVTENSPLMCKVGKLFRRYESTLWTIAEEEALSQINPLPKELRLLESYYSANFGKDEDYRRRDLLTLLNNWNLELDRARAWAKEAQNGLSKRLRHTTDTIYSMEGEIKALEALPTLNGFNVERKSHTLNQLEGLRKKKRFLARELQTCKS